MSLGFSTSFYFPKVMISFDSQNKSDQNYISLKPQSNKMTFPYISQAKC